MDASEAHRHWAWSASTRYEPAGAPSTRLTVPRVAALLVVAVLAGVPAGMLLERRGAPGAQPVQATAIAATADGLEGEQSAARAAALTRIAQALRGDLSASLDRVVALEVQLGEATRHAADAEAAMAAAVQAATGPGGLRTAAGDGTHEVGVDVEPGTYVVLSTSDLCVYRVDPGDPLTGSGVGSGPHAVELADGQRLTTGRCGTWVSSPAP